MYYLCTYREPTGNIHEFINIIDYIANNVSNKVNIELNIAGDTNINFAKPRDPTTKSDNDIIWQRDIIWQMSSKTTHIIIHEMVN